MKKLTILVPYKNREDNMKVFIPYMKNFMKKNFSKIDYNIVIVEQFNDKPFNKGILFNSGFLLTSGNTDYYSLHDIDQLPISSDYSYKDKPYHMCINAIEQGKGYYINTYEKDGYKQRGGMIIINKENYIKSNGHSNKYWGWGLIDDDFSIRLNKSNIGLWRVDNYKNKNYFVSLKTNTDRSEDNLQTKKNIEYAMKLISDEIDYKKDGINDIKFNIINTIKNNDYTLYQIDFDNNDYVK